MSRMPWLGRPAGRHAAGARGRAKAAGDGEPTRPAPASTGPTRPAPHAETPWVPPLEGPPWAAAPVPSADLPRGDQHRPDLLGAPIMADAPTPPLASPLASPVTDAARAAAAESAASLPAYVPPGMEPLITIDALGRKCPIPIIMLAQQIRDVPVGSVIAVLADDPAAYTDIPAWSGLKSHDCVFRADYASGWSFGIRRRY